MGLLRRAALNVDNHANQRINRDVMNPPLEVQLQVLAFKAKELSLIHYDTDFLRQPSGCGPVPPVFRRRDHRVDGKHRWHAVDRPTHLQVLVPLAAAAPALGGCLSLDSHLEDLGEANLGRSATPSGSLWGRVHQVVDLCGTGARRLAPAVHALDGDYGRGGEDPGRQLIRGWGMGEVEQGLFKPCRDRGDEPVLVGYLVEEESAQPL